jgi:lauroyl/myristoyl acyltransferase
MNSNDRCLDIYFRKVLETAAMIPPPWSYRILPITGHLFRDFSSYSIGDGPGVLVRAAHNMDAASIKPACNIKDMIDEYLRFESRFVMENIWIRDNYSQYLKRSYDIKDVLALRKRLFEQNYIIVTAHFSGVGSIVEMVRILGHKSNFIALHPMNLPWDKATPIQRSTALLYKSWSKRQPMIFLNESNPMGKIRTIIRSEQSVMLAADVPGYRGAKVSMFGKSIWVPTGAAKMAWQCNVPILVAIPWASACDKPYNIFLRTIPASRDYDAVMSKIFEHIETVVRLNPAGWNGWLYFHKMLAT